MSQKDSGPFYMGKKFWYTVIATGVFVALAVTGTVAFSSTEVMTFVLSLLGINIGAHTATDITGIIRQIFLERREKPEDELPQGLGAAGGLAEAKPGEDEEDDSEEGEGD